MAVPTSRISGRVATSRLARFRLLIVRRLSDYQVHCQSREFVTNRVSNRRLMRQVVTTANGGIEVLKVQEAPDPKPAAGEVIVQVKAAGLNFADILARQGLYPDGPKKPCVMGYEVAGVSEAVGEGVDPQLAGKPVVAMPRFRGQAEKVAIAANQLFAKPESLSFELAAAIPVNYLTAYALLEVMGSL